MGLLHLKAIYFSTFQYETPCNAFRNITYGHNQLLINVDKVIKVMKCWERIGRQLWIGLKEINNLPTMYIVRGSYPIWPQDHFAPHSLWLQARTTDTQWRHKSKKSEILGRYGRQYLLWPFLKIRDWDLIFGHAVKAISLSLTLYSLIQNE